MENVQQTKEVYKKQNLESNWPKLFKGSRDRKRVWKSWKKGKVEDRGVGSIKDQDVRCTGIKPPS